MLCSEVGRDRTTNNTETKVGTRSGYFRPLSVSKATMERQEEHMLFCRLAGKPYAGAALQALQGPPERQRYFRPVVKAAAEAVPAPIRILEIGSWAGVSAISWGTALKDLNLEGDITCVDPWLPYFDINLNNADVYREMNRAAERSLIYKLFQHNTTAAGLQDILHVKQGSSREVLPHLPERAFTIVYIDGYRTS